MAPILFLTLCPPSTLGPSPHYYCSPSSIESSFPFYSCATLPLASQDPKARLSAVGACAEHQAEGAEPSACFLQF